MVSQAGWEAQQQVLEETVIQSVLGGWGGGWQVKGEVGRVDEKGVSVQGREGDMNKGSSSSKWWKKLWYRVSYRGVRGGSSRGAVKKAKYVSLTWCAFSSHRSC
jgi:hypothetical protein